MSDHITDYAESVVMLKGLTRTLEDTLRDKKWSKAFVTLSRMTVIILQLTVFVGRHDK